MDLSNGDELGARQDSLCSVGIDVMNPIRIPMIDS